MNLGEMQLQLRARIGNPTATDTPNSNLTALINQSLHDVADRFRFHKARKRCRFTTVAGQTGYGLPADCTVVLRLQDVTNFRKLVKVGDRDYATRLNDIEPATWGHPEKYLRYRDSVDLIPVPNGEYVIEVFYKYDVVDLVADADTPGIPPTWHYGLVMYAKYLYYTQEQNDQPKAVLAYEAFQLWAKDKPTEIDEESVDIDTGVVIPTLANDPVRRLDFDHSD